MLELFAGIGGITLGAEMASIETVAFCERETFCQKVLRKNWPNIPIFDDVTTLTKQKLIEAGVLGDGRTIDIISGGYPCQGESLAGERKGADDERWLWPEYFRLVSEIRPAWVVGENVAGHVTMGLDTVLTDLESIGYKAQPFVIPALAVGAPHKRERVFVVAHSGSKSESQAYTPVSTIRSKRNTRNHSSWRIRKSVPGVYWETHQSPVPGVDDGLSDESYKDRVKALGNAVVPQQICPIFKAIAEIEGVL